MPNVLKDIESSDIDVLALVPYLEKAIAEKDIESLQKIDLGLRKMIQSGEVSQQKVASQADKYRHLYELIRQSEAVVKSERAALKKEQTHLMKKKKGSKGYSEIGKL